MAGKLYGIGVGPGNPDLLTLAAVKRMAVCDIIAIPDSGGKEQLALEIANEYIKDKTILTVEMPMIRDQKKLAQCHEHGADILCQQLSNGKDIGFLTLGDPSIYSTYMYLHTLVRNRGYQAEIIPGIPSFCSAAAKLNDSLCIGGESLHIIPASHQNIEAALQLSGTKIFMKAGRKNGELIQLLQERGLADDAALVERCDLSGQRVIKGLKEFNDDSGYFTIVVVKDSVITRKQESLTQRDQQKHHHYPLFINMKNRPVVVFGGGKVAERRIQNLYQFGAEIKIVAPALSESLTEFIDGKNIIWLAKEYEGVDLKNASLAVAATDNRRINQRIGVAAKQQGILVNVADKKAESDFWFSALLEQGDLLAGIISESGNHKLVADTAAFLRAKLEEQA